MISNSDAGRFCSTILSSIRVEKQKPFESARFDAAIETKSYGYSLQL